MTAKTGRMLQGMLMLAVLMLAVLVLGASSVQTWIDQRTQTVVEQRLADELDVRIAELEAEVKRRKSPDGARYRALCFGPYVESGTEVYAVLGVSGCVDNRQVPGS